MDDAVDMTEYEEEDDASSRLRERRMSERTLHAARQKIMGTLMRSTEDLTQDYSRGSTPTPDDPRNIAISLSLAALEGSYARVDVSPRRPGTRRGQSLDVSRQEVDRLDEEEEGHSAEGSIGSKDESRPPPIRRISAGGKFYIPKRSNSPASVLPSP
jgi:hypothetical protein